MEPRVNRAGAGDDAIRAATGAQLGMTGIRRAAQTSPRNTIRMPATDTAHTSERRYGMPAAYNGT